MWNTCIHENFITDPEDKGRAICDNCGDTFEHPDPFKDFMIMRENVVRQYLGEAEYLKRQVYGDP